MTEQSHATETSGHVGEAWSAHFHGKNDEALSRFQQIVVSAPESIDAQYGLGLCLRTAGKGAEAIETFTKIRGLLKTELETDSEDNSRFQMLTRMIEQQIALVR